MSMAGALMVRFGILATTFILVDGALWGVEQFPGFPLPVMIAFGWHEWWRPWLLVVILITGGGYGLKALARLLERGVKLRMEGKAKR